MLISDGIDYEEATHEILEEMNPNQDVVIFSYIVGQASEERSAEMKDIACQSGGDYYTFMAVGKSRWSKSKFCETHHSYHLEFFYDDLMIFSRFSNRQIV